MTELSKEEIEDIMYEHYKDSLDYHLKMRGR